MRRFLARCAAFLWRGRAERELDREMAAHLALMEEDFQRRGMSEGEARLAARRAMGGIDLAKELHRDARSFVWLEQFAQDLRHAARSLRRSPGFALVAIATLALGVGVNATLFSAYNAVALRPLPVADPDRVVRLERWFQKRNYGSRQYAFSFPEYLYCRNHSSVFSAVAAGSFGISEMARISGQPEKIYGQLVSANYFDSLGIAAQLGRTFLPEEDTGAGAHPVLVISNGFWQRRFHGDAGVLGKTVQIRGIAYTIVGVAARDFTSTAVDDPFAQFWAPLSMQAQLAPPRRWMDDPTQREVQLIGRLRPAVSLKSAEAEVSVLIRQFAGTYKDPEPTASVTLQHTAILGNTEDIRFKGVVAGILLLVGLVLLVACANVANMLLARAAGRQREIGVRIAMGAGRGRMIRHLLTESLLLSFCGGVAGLLVAQWTSRLLSVTIAGALAGTPAANNGFVLDMSLDVRVFAYAFALSLASGLFFGLAPALQFTRPDLNAALKEEGSSYGQRLTRSRLRGFLVGAQVTVSMMLLIVAGLLLRGLTRSYEAEPGFDARRVLLLSADFGAHPEEAQARLLNLMNGRPEIESAALGIYPMMGTWTPPIVVRARSGGPPPRGRTLASYATENYLATLGVPLLRGRNFTAQEVRSSAPAAIISESAARRFWPSEDPLGRTFQLDMDFNGRMAEFQVIGVVRDIRFANLTRLDPAHVYLTPRPGDFQGMLLRARGDARSAMEAVRATVGEFDRDLLPGLYLTSVQDGPMVREKKQADLVARFASILAGLALLLAGVGIYGVMSYLVSQRVREIGIRMALGASTPGVLRSVVLQSLRPVMIGMAAGIALAAALSTVLHATLVFPGSTDVLYGVPFYDPATFLGLAAFLTGVAAIASAVPARRAARVDPMVALRCD